MYPLVNPLLVLGRNEIVKAPAHHYRRLEEEIVGAVLCIENRSRMSPTRADCLGRGLKLNIPSLHSAFGSSVSPVPSKSSGLLGIGLGGISKGSPQRLAIINM
ncbi:hypothetical protein PISMIDRAFT_688599 [Pisolithus microcarpus 441]|uniref:Uncharacterized protein n=1 Tax=Pisolithus microcarpus 441 TaxID=765257 RepID=A0A0C9YIE0_9AGAM|nr:hypothetical protein PISMIDRAFT_688599 [Pisolithus microcarpus 441]